MNTLIITQTPFRFCLGGGVDIRPYYSKYGKGFALSGTINYFVKIIITSRDDNKIVVSYLGNIEVADKVDDIKHPLIREVLKFTKIKGGIEIVTLSDITPQSGLGSSGSFEVGLLNALHTFKGEDVSREQLAEEACYIEMDVLKCPSGKQDQYLAAFGGIVELEIDRNGKVKVKPIRLSNNGLRKLESNLLVFDTGIRRSAGKVLSHHQKDGQLTKETAEKLSCFKQAGISVKEALKKEKLDEYGRLLDRLWEQKKSYSEKVTNPQIDSWYQQAVKAGALGGKVMGAGGGGFIIVYTEDTKRENVRDTMAKLGLKELRYNFYPQGTKVLLNL